MSKQHNLDQFYTKPSIVGYVLPMVDLSQYDLIVEPSAGAGDFYKKLPAPTRIGLDLEPACANISRQDFFDYRPTQAKNILTIGNPPFGKNSSNAVKFFNHAATFSSCIAFIVPRTFRKASIINKLDKRFHLITEEILPLEAFYLPTGESYSVPTVFQVWQKQESDRQDEEIYHSHPDFEFLGTESYDFSHVEVTVAQSSGHYGQEDKTNYQMTDEELQQIKSLRKKYPRMFSAHRIAKAKKLLTWNTEPDFAWRRAGRRAGEIFEEYQEHPTEGFEFIKLKNNTAMEVFRAMWHDVWDPTYNSEKTQEKWDTAGQPSISKHELIKRYKETKNKYE